MFLCSGRLPRVVDHADALFCFSTSISAPKISISFNAAYKQQLQLCDQLKLVDAVGLRIGLGDWMGCLKAD